MFVVEERFLKKVGGGHQIPFQFLLNKVRELSKTRGGSLYSRRVTYHFEEGSKQFLQSRGIREIFIKIPLKSVKKDQKSLFVRAFSEKESRF